MNPWQIYSQNGDPLAMVGGGPDDFENDPCKVMAAAHVWMWQTAPDGTKEVALQKRAADKTTWGGYLDITTAGHVDVNESPLQAALRESVEEINYHLDPGKLIWLFACRAATNRNEIDHVYAYEYDPAQTFAFNDGEVQSVHWYALTDFEAMAKDPAAHNLVPQGEYYFTQLVNYIQNQ